MEPYYEDAKAGIVIYCGDCREVLPAMDAVADLVLTDPPYGIGYTARSTRSAPFGGRSKVGRVVPAKDYPKVHGDDVPFDPSPILGFRKLIVWGGNHFANRLPPSPTWLVWDKRCGMAQNDSADCEIAWSNLGGPARVFRHLWMGMLRDSEKGESFHPNQKPLAVIRWCLAMAAEARLILDPFMGSGTTLRAAKDFGRRAIGIEIEERYCEIAARRLDQGVLQFGE